MTTIKRLLCTSLALGAFMTGGGARADTCTSYEAVQSSAGGNRLEIDGSYAFYSAGPDLWRVPKAANQDPYRLRLIQGVGQSTSFKSLGLDTSYVYFTLTDGKTIGKVIKNGTGSWITWVDGSKVDEYFDQLGSLTIDGSYVYWTAGDASRSAHIVLKRALNDSNPPTIHVLYSTPGSPFTGPGEIAEYGSDTYWLDTQNHKLKQTPKTGGTTMDLASGLGGGTTPMGGVQSDGTSVFFVWKQSGGGGTWKLQRKDLGVGGSPADLANGNAMSRLRLDGNLVYFTNGNYVMTIPKSGDPNGPTTHVNAGTTVYDIAVDSQDVYFLTCCGLYRCRK